MWFKQIRLEITFLLPFSDSILFAIIKKCQSNSQMHAFSGGNGKVMTEEKSNEVQRSPNNHAIVQMLD